MTNNMNPAHLAAINTHRETDGKFGYWSAGAPDVGIDSAAVDAADYLKDFQTDSQVILDGPEGMVPVTVLDAGALTGAPDDMLSVETPDGDVLETVFASLKSPGQAAVAINAQLEAENAKFAAYFADYDSKLSDEHVVAYLSGDMEAFNTVYDGWEDHRWANETEAIKTILEERNLERNDVDEDILLEYIRDNDDSDLAGDLLRHSATQLMRVPLGHVYGEGTYSGHQDGVYPARHRRIGELLEKHGLKLETDEQYSAIEELVANGPFDWHDGVQLQVIYQGDIREATVWNPDAGEAQEKNLTFQGVNILLIDQMSGSGHDVTMPGTLTAKVSPSRPVILDADPNGGYGWDEVAGVVHSYYAAEVSTEWAPEPKDDKEAA